MRSTSRKRRFLAAALSILLLPGTGGFSPVLADTPPEPCILIKVFASPIPAAEAKERLDELQALLTDGLNVRWVSTHPSDNVARATRKEFPTADAEALAAIARNLEEANRHMDRMETEAAAASLGETERLARSFRFTEATRPYLAEVFLRRGILFLWEGDSTKAVEMIARSRALRPEFSPDPAMYSPPFMDAWKSAGQRPTPQAELLVTSVPPSARIFLDGREAGTTPGRVRLPHPGPVTIRVSAGGYLPGERTEQYLPGDYDLLDFSLVPDRNAVLAQILSSSPDGKEAGPILSRMIIEAGATRAGLLLLEEGSEGQNLRVLSQERDQDVPVVLGTVGWHGGEGGTGRVAETAVALMQQAGWPQQSGTDDALSPWYHKWWFWTIVGIAAVGVAAGISGSGGGGSSGSSSGTIGVDF